LIQNQTKISLILRWIENCLLNCDCYKARKYIENVTSKVVKAFKAEIETDNIEFIEGFACFIDEDNICIKTDDEEIIISADYYIIATGSSNICLNSHNTTKLLGIDNICSI